MRVVFCATHPAASNGYSKIAYELCKRLGARDDVELHWFGFQNMDPDSRVVRPLPARVKVFDAMAHEKPPQHGFGFEQIAGYVREVNPDIVIVYNDAIVCTQIMSKLAAIENPSFKIMIYQDLVYEHVRRVFVDVLNARADRVLAFTPYWQGVLQKSGVTKPMSFLRHGFNPETMFPIPKALARRYFRIAENDFVILNLNRNQPRKRWDVVLKAFAEFVSRHRGEAFKLLIGTALAGAWHLIEIFDRELQKRGITLQEGMRHLIVVDAPQKLSDEDINILMNCADIGINAADGEGFGLCNFEHAAIGKPQVVPRIGGFHDFFRDEHAMLCDPVLAYYLDTRHDGVGGEAVFIDYQDMTSGIEFYYANRDKMAEHGRLSREKILAEYRWDDIADKLHGECLECLKKAEAPKAEAEAPKAEAEAPKAEEPAPKAEEPAPKAEAEAPKAEEAPRDIATVKQQLATLTRQLTMLAAAVDTMA
jgi:D-inositol-3-phosphate glycosyltransferase